METWILFFWFAGQADSEVKTVEFASEAACEAAAEQLMNERRRYKYFCAPKQ